VVECHLVTLNMASVSVSQDVSVSIWELQRLDPTNGCWKMVM